MRGETAAGPAREGAPAPEGAPVPAVASPRRVTVGVVAICGEAALERCLAALEVQEGAPPFDVVVALAPGLAALDRLRARHPHVAFHARPEERTPPEMARRVVVEADGELVALLEDHGAPRPDWLARLLAAVAPGRAAVGGVVDVHGRAGRAGRALWLADFFRYAPPAPEGPSPSLTHCNVLYRREDLEAIAPLWRSIFHETEIHAALARRGALWLEPRARVESRRRVRLGAAIAERASFGRLYGASRARLIGRGRRWAYAALAPLLPPLLLARIARRALTTPGLRTLFLGALPPLVLLLLAWTWGETLGYWTGREPADLVVAPDVDDGAARAGSAPSPSGPPGSPPPPE